MMPRATIAGRTVTLCGCDDMIHADKFARFGATSPTDDQVIRVFLCDGRLTPPSGTPSGCDGMVDWYVLPNSTRQLFHRQGLFSLTFNDDFSEVMLQLCPAFDEWEALRYLYVSQCISYHALAHGAMVFHGAGLVIGDKAVIAAGDSGTGKTTLADRLTKADPSVVVLSDETVIVTREADGFYANGTPLCGQDHRFAAESAPLGGVILLGRGETDRWYKAPAASTVFRLLSTTLRPIYHEALSKVALDRVIALAQTIPVYCFDHTAGPETLSVLTKGLREL